jgi:hypothetical protein
MPRHPGTTQRLLDLCLSLPVGAPDHVLDAALTAHSPGLAHATRLVRMSEMRVCTHPRVRASLATIAAWASLRGAPDTARYAHAFITAARAIRDRRQLP